MSARVIQDSDDEDDPLSCEAQPPPPPTTIARRSSPAEIVTYDGAGEASEYQAQYQNANAGRGPGVEDIGVNFDDFLQSQSQDYNSKYARDPISSSQQRREDRWLPNGDGIARGSSSIELGLTQRRLMDNNATGLPSTASLPDDRSYLQDMHGTVVTEKDQGFGYSESAFPPAHEVQAPPFYDPNQPLRDPYNSMTYYDNGDANGSYNIFDTSHNTFPAESLYRSKSLQITPSPHDTEPLSSLNTGRSRSDNNHYLKESVPQQQFADMNSQDELSAPVAVETPMVPPQKKQSQKKPRQIEDDEDDELAGPKDTNIHENGVNTENAGHSPNIKRPTTNHEEPNLDSNKHADDEIQIVSVNVIEDSTKKQPKAKAKDKDKDKEPKKKKVKRGKTTSETVKKTHEPGVEADVIWVNQSDHPSKPNQDLQEYSVQEHFIPTPDSILIAADERPENPAMRATAEIPGVSQGQDKTQETQSLEQKPTPAQGNKRGRKRKKTTEQAPPSEIQPQPQQAQEPGPEPEPEQKAEPQPSIHPEPEVEPQQENQSATPVPDQDKEQTTTATSSKQPETPTKAQSMSEKPGSESDVSGKNKGPTKHSPIPATSSAPYRVGLSRRARIAPLLKIIRR